MTFAYLQRQIWIQHKLCHFLGPSLKLVCLWIDEVIEHCAMGRELDSLEFCDPPFGELDAVIHQLEES